MKLKSIIIVLSSSIALLTSCANSDDYGIIDIEYQELDTTKTIDEIKEIATANATLYQEDDIIEGYVVSSDEGGTFYKSISFQNLEGTAGFSMAVDNHNLYSEVEPGRKVFIKLKGLYIGQKHDGLVIGDLFNESEVGRLTPAKFREHIAISKETKTEEELVHVRTIDELKDNKYINTLVEIQDVQFEIDAVGKPFYDAQKAFGGATNYNVEQLIGEEIKKIVVRTSEFADFAKNLVPEERGTMRGVITKYNTTYQFGIRTLKDLNLTEKRFHLSTAIGGENMTFLTSVNEDFSSFPTSNTQSSFPIYGNDYSIGGRYWSVREFGGNKYIQLTAYGNQAEETKSYFIVPVSYNGNNTLSFKTKDGHYKENVLNVYYTKVDNYTYGDFINTSLFENITSQFNIAQGTTSGYAQNFTESGTYNFPSSLVGEGYIIFEYAGSKTNTTTMQLDDIVFN